MGGEGLTLEAGLDDASNAFMEEAFPRGSMTLLETAGIIETEALLLETVSWAVSGGLEVLVAVSNLSPERLLRGLRTSGVDTDARLKDGKLKIIDWYSHKEEELAEPEERGGVVRCPRGLEALEGALTLALEEPKEDGMALLEIMSDIVPMGLKKATKFFRTLVKKLSPAYSTSVIFVEDGLLGPALREAVTAKATNQVQVVRHWTEEGMEWRAVVTRNGEEVNTYTLVPKQGACGFLLAPSEEILPQEEQVGAQACPKCGSSLEGEECSVCGYTPEDSRLWKIREIYERCESRLQEDPQDVDALFTKAAALARLKDYEAAVEVLNELTKLEPRYPGLWMLKAKLFDRLGEEVKANLCRQRALDLQRKEMGIFLEARVEPDGDRFQCPLCQRWLPLEATVCPCGAEFVEEE